MGKKLPDQAMSRRAALAGMGALGLGVLGATTLGGCSPKSADEAPAENAQADVVVVGSGLAGMVAAVKAQELGKTAVVVEKSEEVDFGGNSIIAGGTFIIPPTNDQEGIDIFVDDLMKQSSDRGNEALLRIAGERAWESIAWMEGVGAPFVEPTVTEPFRVMGTTPEPGSWSMPTALNALRDAFEANGGEILFGTKMTKLVFDDAGKVIGIEARTGRGVTTVLGSCVILATGGYAGNKGLLELFIGPDADEMMVRGRSTATGDGMMAAFAAGAGLCQVGGYEALHIAAVSPDDTASGNPSPGLPYMVAINAEGKRFVDESLGYVAHGKAVAVQPGTKDALIFDAAQAQQNPYVQYVIGLFQEKGLPIHEAGSLAELAEMIEVPPAALEATIAEFNAHVSDDNAATGMAVDKASHAYKMETAPYYALYPLVPGITLSFGGLLVDEKSRVLEPDGRSMPGLYAAGEVTGGLFVDDYIAGGSMITSLVFALIAAESAAEGA